MKHEMIVVIVERGKAEGVVKKAVQAGARGATVVYGRGSGEHVLSFFRSLKVEPAKEVIAIVASEKDVDVIFEAVVDAAQVKKKGKGIAFTVPLGRMTGINTEEQADNV